MFNRKIFTEFDDVDDNYVKQDFIENYNFQPGSINELKNKNKNINDDTVKKLYSNQIKYMSIIKQCYKCGDKYKDIENFKWECWYHPGKLDAYNGNTYTCCGTSVVPGCSNYERIGSKKGCVKCDHKCDSYKYTEFDDQRIPKCLIDIGILKIREDEKNVIECVTNSDDVYKSFCVVRRFESNI